MMFASVEALNREKIKNMMHWRRRDKCSFKSDYITERGGDAGRKIRNVVI